MFFFLLADPDCKEYYVCNSPTYVNVARACVRVGGYACVCCTHTHIYLKVQEGRAKARTNTSFYSWPVRGVI